MTAFALAGYYIGLAGYAEIKDLSPAFYALDEAKIPMVIAISSIAVNAVASFFFRFFFQAEDGIRDRNVTGVQTCALPILCPGLSPAAARPRGCGGGRRCRELDAQSRRQATVQRRRRRERRELAPALRREGLSGAAHLGHEHENFEQFSGVLPG